MLDALGAVVADADRRVYDELRDPGRRAREERERKKDALFGFGMLAGVLALGGAMLYGTVAIARRAWKG